MPERRQTPGPDWIRVVREAAPYLGLGTSLAVTVLVGLWLGYSLDQRFGTYPVFILTGAVFGLFAAGYLFFRSVTGQRP